MSVLPSQTSWVYPRVDQCIYCGSRERLTDEHIFPYGLGGRWVIPNGSCSECARVTSAFEGVVQRTMLGPLRLMFGMPSRRKRERPKKLPLKVRVTPGADWTFMDVDQEVYPFLVLLPNLTLPDEITGFKRDGPRHAAAKTYWIRGASLRNNFDEHCHGLAAELGVVEIMPTATSDAESFFRMLAKIAHAYAVAELGSEAFKPFLIPMIQDGDTREAVQYVGGIAQTEGVSTALHQAWIAPYPADPSLLAVRVRLLACLGTPTYVVAVGRKK